jgi:hypothetical protein
VILRLHTSRNGGSSGLTQDQEAPTCSSNSSSSSSWVLAVLHSWHYSLLDKDCQGLLLCQVNQGLTLEEVQQQQQQEAGQTLAWLALPLLPQMHSWGWRSSSHTSNSSSSSSSSSS